MFIDASAIIAMLVQESDSAVLNMGDGFAYACARSLDVPILAKRGDFPQTDIAIG